MVIAFRHIVIGGLIFESFQSSRNSVDTEEVGEYRGNRWIPRKSVDTEEIGGYRS